MDELNCSSELDLNIYAITWISEAIQNLMILFDSEAGYENARCKKTFKILSFDFSLTLLYKGLN